MTRSGRPYRKGVVVATLAAAVALLVVTGCGSASGDNSGNAHLTETLRPADVAVAMRTLPFPAEVRRIPGPLGNIASFRGRAHGKHDTELEFSIGIGDPPKVISVLGAGTSHAIWEEAYGFVFNDDSFAASKFRTAAQWREVAIMAARVCGSLCRVVTGEPCPV